MPIIEYKLYDNDLLEIIIPQCPIYNLTESPLSLEACGFYFEQGVRLCLDDNVVEILSIDNYKLENSDLCLSCTIKFIK